MFLVLSGVKQTTDLVDPLLANIALHPTLLVDFVVLLLHQICFYNRKINQFDGSFVIQLIIALVTPKVLVVSTNVEVTVSSNAFASTIHTVTEEDWWLE
jgi:hypothetical protein